MTQERWEERGKEEEKEVMVRKYRLLFPRNMKTCVGAYRGVLSPESVLLYCLRSVLISSEEYMVVFLILT